jgi:GMP reductase
MKISNDVKLDFDDILLVPSRSPNASRKDVKLNRTYKFFHSNKEWNGLPIMAANMDTTGTFSMGSELLNFNAITCLHKHYTAEKILSFYEYSDCCSNVWMSIGMKKEDLIKVNKVACKLGWCPNICIDIANGYTEKFVEWCSDVRNLFDYGPKPIIMAGNVCTPEMVSELILHGGVDIVKIGIGPGSACTTRLKTGVGYPQLSAIIECSHAAHGLKSDEKRMGLICADGGCRLPADVCKAFAANADFVMLGGMLAGADECEGEWEYEEHYVEEEVKVTGAMRIEKIKKSLLFYGMSSEKAQNKHNGSMADYKASEGRVKKIAYKGPAKDVMNEICGGLRSCCAYLGATSLKDLPKCSKAVMVNRTHFDGST